MDTTPSPSRKSRFDLRLRRRASNQPPARDHRRANPAIPEKEEDSALEARDDLKDRSAMAKDHRMFHRRAPEVATQVVTVAIEVIATVDVNGNVLGQETVLPQVPSLPVPTEVPVLAVPVVSNAPLQSVVAQAPPSDPAVAALVASVPEVPVVPTPAAAPLPQVPSVPPFPSDLKVPTVPSFPWPSGDPIAAAAAATANSAAPAPTSEAAQGLGTTPVPEANSTSATSAVLAVPSSLTSLESGLSLSLSPTLSSLSAGQSSHTSSALSRSGSTVATADPAATNYYGPGGNPAAPGTTAPAADTQASGSPAPLETPQVVGSVIGSLAGAALILAIILLLIRRHKRKRGGTLQLTGDDHDQQPMRQTPARNSRIPSTFLNRFSGMSRSTVETNTSGERSFQKVSGRKLPSAFSEGMTSDQFSRGGTMSGSSFYQDDQGTYGGTGYSKEFGKEIGEVSNYRGSGPMNFRPSPARTPIIRHPDDENPFSNNHRIQFSPPQSPNSDFPPPRGTLGRSIPSADGSRSSRFTENV